jgi:hypothetical protein
MFTIRQPQRTIQSDLTYRPFDLSVSVLITIKIRNSIHYRVGRAQKKQSLCACKSSKVVSLKEPKQKTNEKNKALIKLPLR